MVFKLQLDFSCARAAEENVHKENVGLSALKTHRIRSKVNLILGYTFSCDNLKKKRLLRTF